MTVCKGLVEEGFDLFIARVCAAVTAEDGVGRRGGENVLRESLQVIFSDAFNLCHNF